VTQNKAEPKRVQVTFSTDQWELLMRLKGIMGQTDAEVVRNIVILWLAEKSIISTEIKRTIMGDAK
jgi:hypothetical protein